MFVKHMPMDCCVCVCVNYDLIETASTLYIDSLLDITILTIISLLIAYLKETNIN